MSSETIIGDVVEKNVKEGTLIIKNPVLLETVYSDNARYVLMRDLLKDSMEIYMPIQAMNIMYSYPAAPEVEAYYRGCIPTFERAKTSHREMYKGMLDELVKDTLAENMFEIKEGQFLQPSSTTVN